jgi:hypothetical protein
MHGRYLSGTARACGVILNSREACPATLNGGEWDQPYITVVLDFRASTAARTRACEE